jgi:NADH dehydrogenase (ubiquinone) 1 alpha subcomplex subunit 10
MLLKQITRLTFLKSSINIESVRLFSVADIGKTYPKPYDYKYKPYGLYGRLTDSTLKRLNDNSLIITVDGNFGSGKSEFAKTLAREINFHHAKEIDFDDLLYTKTGNNETVNLRLYLNQIVEQNERFRITSIDEWHENPNYKRAIEMQKLFFYCRYQQYRIALLHLLSTGQGVVLERSPFSDYVLGKGQALSTELDHF